MTQAPTVQAPTGTILFEFRRLGNAVKASAIQVETNTEVCVMGPAGASHHALKAAALRKLIYVLARRDGEQRARSA